jgi:hypothetical protein
VLVAPKREMPADRRALVGIDRGKVRLAADFDAPLPEEVRRAFEGGD